jgi:hypothetical protein
MNREKLRQILLTPLRELGLRSSAIKNIEERLGVYVVGQLLCLEYLDAVAGYNMGRKTKLDLLGWLNQRGLKIEMLREFRYDLGMTDIKHSYRKFESISEVDSVDDFSSRLTDEILDQIIPNINVKAENHDLWLVSFLPEKLKGKLGDAFLKATGDDPDLLSQIFDIVVSDPKLDKKAIIDAFAGNVSTETRCAIEELVKQCFAKELKL